MFLPNTLPWRGRPLFPSDADLLGPGGAAAARAWLTRQDGAAPTPLTGLPVLAERLGLDAILVKDESARLGLGSFKALGGAYAVAALCAARGGGTGATFACATDGNHGRSVAWGARQAGAACVIFVHAGVSEARAGAMAALGARIVRVAGTYDDSVAEAARASAEQGWTLVSDIASPGAEQVPGLVMQGYTALAREVLDTLAGRGGTVSHVFIQAGVGGLAAAVFAHLALCLGERRPRFVVVEPARAACLFESARAGQAVRIGHGGGTVMAMLDCDEPSSSAWRILAALADGFMTLEDDEAVAAMRILARPGGGDPPMVAGESGGAGLAGLLQAAGDTAARRALGLDGASRVLLINSEGATDPALYERLVGP